MLEIDSYSHACYFSSVWQTLTITTTIHIIPTRQQQSHYPTQMAFRKWLDDSRKKFLCKGAVLKEHIKNKWNHFWDISHSVSHTPVEPSSSEEEEEEEDDDDD